MKRNPTLIGSSKVTRGRVTIPQDIREKFNIKSGDFIYFFTKENDEIIIQKGPLIIKI